MGSRILAPTMASDVTGGGAEKQVFDTGRLLPHVKLSPETLSVYARTQTQPDRICTIEALALFLQECGEGTDTCDSLISYLQINNAALRNGGCKEKSEQHFRTR